MQTIIKALSWSLIHSLWQGAIVFGLVFFIFFLLPKLSAVRRHNISFLALCTICVWFLITFFNRLNFSSTAVSFDWNEASFIFLNSGENQSFQQTAESWFPLLTAAYLFGLAIQLLITWRGFAIVRRLRKDGLANVPEEWQTIFFRVAGRLNIRRNIEFKLSSKIQVPVVIGFLKPLVLFPIQVVNHLDLEQTEAILIHELTHIKRHDFLLNLIQTIIQTLLFFNPFIWMISRWIKQEREHACDDRVIEFTGQRLNYANALLQLEILKRNSVPQYAMAAANKKQDLYTRIKRITLLKTNLMNTKQFFATISVILLAILSVAWMIPHAQKNKTEIQTKNNKSGIEVLETKRLKLSQLAQVVIDTTPKNSKKQVQIILTDSSGNSQTFTSIKEVPDSLKKSYGLTKNKDLSIIINGQPIEISGLSPIMVEGFKLNADSLRIISQKTLEKINSPEFQQKQKEILEKINSPEFKEQQRKILDKINSPEFQKKQQELIEKMNSPEFKEQQKKFLEKFEKFKFDQFSITGDSIVINGKEFQIFGNGSIFQKDEEWKKSKEYQKLQEKYKKELEKIKKKYEKQKEEM